MGPSTSAYKFSIKVQQALRQYEESTTVRRADVLSGKESKSKEKKDRKEKKEKKKNFDKTEKKDGDKAKSKSGKQQLGGPAQAGRLLEE